MPMRMRKPAEAGDGSYRGSVLQAFDRLAAQLEFPMGTVHRCPMCLVTYRCDEDECLLGISETCRRCAKWPLAHALAAQNRAKRDPAYAAKLARIDARMRGAAAAPKLTVLNGRKP